MPDPSREIAGLRAPLDRLADPLPIPTLSRAFDVEIIPPGSKSISNRALLLAALASGESLLRGALTDADDGRVMLAALRVLGAEIREIPEGLRIRGVGGRPRAPRDDAPLMLENAGTAMRFLSAACAIADAPITLDGDARMRERPIGELAEALHTLGARVEWLAREGFPPLRIIPPAGGMLGGEIQLARTRSGQFISALLLLAPYTRQGLRVRCPQGVTSPPYVEMTLRLLERVGVHAVKRTPDLAEMFVPAHQLQAFTLDVEPDASGAGYFWAAAAMTPDARVLIPGLSRVSLQGDVHIVDVLARMGATVEETPRGLAVRAPHDGLRAVDADLSGIPDAAMTIAVAACVAKGPSRLQGLRTLRDKETDRLEALRIELTKLGAAVRIERERDDESLIIEPAHAPTAHTPIDFDTYHDHRMAMSLALLGLVRPAVRIRNPACVAKTYPTFWSDLSRLYAPSTP
ncbi:MAG: 3-phosphoshikimate 1-carboxyvinyltransferase [Phycisphaerales bacterium]